MLPQRHFEASFKCAAEKVFVEVIAGLRTECTVAIRVEGPVAIGRATAKH